MLVLRDNIGMTLYRAEDGHEVGSYEHSNVPSAVLSPDGSLVAVGTGSNIENREREERQERPPCWRSTNRCARSFFPPTAAAS